MKTNLHKNTQSLAILLLMTTHLITASCAFCSDSDSEDDNSVLSFLSAMIADTHNALIKRAPTNEETMDAELSKHIKRGNAYNKRSSMYEGLGIDITYHDGGYFGEPSYTYTLLNGKRFDDTKLLPLSTLVAKLKHHNLDDEAKAICSKHFQYPSDRYPMGGYCASYISCVNDREKFDTEVSKEMKK